MAQANIAPITAACRPATSVEIIDVKTGEVLTAAEYRRRALMRRLWSAHTLDGRAR